VSGFWRRLTIAQSLARSGAAGACAASRRRWWCSSTSTR